MSGNERGNRRRRKKADGQASVPHEGATSTQVEVGAGMEAVSAQGAEAAGAAVAGSAEDPSQGPDEETPSTEPGGDPQVSSAEPGCEPVDPRAAVKPSSEGDGEAAEAGAVLVPSSEHEGGQAAEAGAVLESSSDQDGERTAEAAQARESSEPVPADASPVPAETVPEVGDAATPRREPRRRRSAAGAEAGVSRRRRQTEDPSAAQTPTATPDEGASHDVTLSSTPPPDVPVDELMGLAEGGELGGASAAGETTDVEAVAEVEPVLRAVSDDEPPGTLPAADVGRAHLKGLIEALVFVSDRPVSILEIARAAGKADRKLVRALVDELRREYAPRGIHLDEVAGGLLFRTSAVYAPFVRDAAARKPVRMSRAQVETLAIVAYRQPLTRPEIDEIRGVDSGPVLKMLLERDLVRILGKKDEPGRPLLYGTTPAFLEFFGLKSLRDLPSLREFTELSDDSRKIYEQKMDEPFEGAPPPTPENSSGQSAQGGERTTDGPEAAQPASSDSASAQQSDLIEPDVESASAEPVRGGDSETMASEEPASEPFDDAIVGDGRRSDEPAETQERAELPEDERGARSAERAETPLPAQDQSFAAESESGGGELPVEDTESACGPEVSESGGGAEDLDALTDAELDGFAQALADEDLDRPTDVLGQADSLDEPGGDSEFASDWDDERVSSPAAAQDALADDHAIARGVPKDQSTERMVEHPFETVEGHPKPAPGSRDGSTPNETDVEDPSLDPDDVPEPNE